MIVDPQGNVIPSRGEDRTGMYQRLARLTYAEMKARYPDLAENKFAWGARLEHKKGGGLHCGFKHWIGHGARGHGVASISSISLSAILE
jgi:hypothetical protein